MKYINLTIAYVLFLATLLLHSPSQAQDTGSPINVTMDKSEMIRLDHDAASIIVGNPAHVSVLAENPRLLVVIPKTPGATHFSVLDKDGNMILERHVIVAAPSEKYVRIRKSCAASADETCQSTQTYYCPDMCHEIAPAPETDGTVSASASTDASRAAGSGADIGEAQGTTE